LKALEQICFSGLGSEVANLRHRCDMSPPSLLTLFNFPEEVSLCGEAFPLEDRNVWETWDREFLRGIVERGPGSSMDETKGGGIFPLLKKKKRPEGAGIAG